MHQEEIEVLDLFSAAAGGWSLGMHRAGFKTIAACEFVDWRRALYQQNNPGVRIYDDVRTLTADQLLRDFGRLPSVVVGSPPCQDISSANTKGKGVEGERSGLYFEAVRIVGEVRPRWFALENSSNLRTRGADAVLSELEALGYACWSFVVRAGDIGANHERPRCWIIGCDVEQVANADGLGWNEGWGGGRSGFNISVSEDIGDTSQDGCRSRFPGRRAGAVAGAEQPPCGNAAYTDHDGELCGAVYAERGKLQRLGDHPPRDAPHADQAGQAHGCMVSSLRQAKISDDGRGSQWSDDGSSVGQVAVCEGDCFDPATWRSDWSLDDLAGRVLLDARIQAWTFVAFLLDEGGQECLAEQLIAEAKSAGFAAKFSLGSDLRAALRIVLASYNENTALRLAPIAETMSGVCNITLALENSWDFAAKSAEGTNGSRSTTLTKSGPTTQPITSKRSARLATPSTTSERDLRAVHLRAERRFKRSASRLVEAFGDAVVPQIPEVIGRAILRTEHALSIAYGRAA